MTGPLTYTLITSRTPPRLCKVMSLLPDGTLHAAAAANMAEGEARTVTAADLNDLAQQLDALAPSQAPAWGVTGRDVARVLTTTNKHTDPTAIARSRDDFQYAERPGAMMLDLDAMPPGWPPCPDALSVWGLLVSACPALAAAPMLIRPSSSAGITDAAGRVLKPLGKWRAYIPVARAADIPAAGDRLCSLLWAAGLGWWGIGKNGQLLQRQVLDSAVWKPEHLDFAAAPELRDDLRRPRAAAWFYGDPAGRFDLAAVQVSREQAARAEALKQQMRPAAEAEAAPVRAAWIAKQARRIAARTGRSVVDVEAALHASGHTLPPDFPLVLESGEIVTVHDVMSDRAKYDGQRLFDPYETDTEDDSRIAKLCLNAAVPHVNSFAHGPARYGLQVDPSRVPWTVAPVFPSAHPDPSAPLATPKPYAHFNADTPLDTARVFIAEKFPGDALRYWQGAYYRWRAGAWREVGKEDPHAWVYQFLDGRPERTHYVPNQTNVGKVLDALRAAAHLDSATAPPAWLDAEAGPPPGELVACANGLLHMPTGRLLPPTPRLFNFNALPVAFDPAAPPPAAWLRFLAEVWPDDPEAVQVLQELFGYLLTPDTSQQKIFLIVGPRRSGKGTVARVLTALLGSDNVASPSLGSTSETFGLQPLVGKLAAVVSDARLGGRADQQTVAENLLRISGEDQVDVNRKFLAPLTVRLGVRFVMLTNELPKIADASGAIASRFVILTMTESFYGREDPGLTPRLLVELSGVLNWAIEGWHRLRGRGFFTVPRSSAELTQELADLGSPIGTFVRECCDVMPGAKVGSQELYEAWRLWCRGRGVDRIITKEHFGRDLRAYVPELRRARTRGANGREPVYEAIALRPGALAVGPAWGGGAPALPAAP